MGAFVGPFINIDVSPKKGKGGTGLSLVATAC